mmetsp:Transcript_64162/g.186036  ORF Transcript_64162/g.186036 Transcript_64162/m.186036 type:complete len:481 (+) Transcript_64162:68-1510(+)
MSSGLLAGGLLLLAAGFCGAARLAAVLDAAGRHAAGASLAEVTQASTAQARFPALALSRPMGTQGLFFTCSGLSLQPPVHFCPAPFTARAATVALVSKPVAVEDAPGAAFSSDDDSLPSRAAWSSQSAAVGPNASAESIEIDGEPLCGVRVLNRLGSGQFGEVWKARVRTGDMDRDVALKVFNCGRNLSSSGARIRREAALLGRLSGGRFPKYFGWMRYNGSVALAMELFPGTLQDLVVKKSFEDVNLTQRLHLFEQLIAGLNQLSEEGLVHRDIKPSNLVVNVSGDTLDLKIVDFGYTRSAIDGPTEFELVGAEARRIAGTSLYLSPESWRALWSPLGDAWAAGIVLYELLFEGRLPGLFYEASARTDNQTLAQEIFREFNIREDALFKSVQEHAFATNDVYLIVLLSLLESMLARDWRERLEPFQVTDMLGELSKLPQNTAKHLAEVQALIREKAKEVPVRERQWKASSPVRQTSIRR